MANSLATQQLGLKNTQGSPSLSDCERIKGPFRVESWFSPVLLGISNVSLIPGATGTQTLQLEGAGPI